MGDSTASIEIEWDSLDKLKRNDLQRLCKELQLNIKGTSKNADLIDALLEYRKSTLSNTSESTKEDTPKIVNITSNDDIENTSSSKSSKKKKEKENSIDNSNNSDNSNNDNNDNSNNDNSNNDNSNNGNNDNSGNNEMIIDQVQQKDGENESEKIQVEQDNSLNNNNNNINNNSNINSNNDNSNNENITQQEEQVEIENNQVEEEEEIIGLKFRNYIPKEPKLLKYRVEKAPVPPIAEELMSRLKVLETNPDIQISFVPKKVNWDLKRDCSKKLAKLEKQTEKAIYQLIKQKLGKEEINESNVYLLSKTMDKSTY